MTISIRTGLLIALWIIVTIITAILLHGKNNSTIILAYVSIPFFLIAIGSIFIGQIKGKKN